jgi:ribosome modulation factor
MYKGILFSGTPKAIHPDASEPLSYQMLFGFLADGYKTGINWKSKETPGGPWESINAKRDRLLNKAWFVGFFQGLKDKQNA